MPPYERDNIRRMSPYVPGEQPGHEDADRVIKLNTNENPYAPAPQVMETVRNLSPEALRMYPPPEAARFRAVAAETHGVAPEQVIATNGGDELLRLAVTVFCGVERGGIGTTVPSYSLYQVLGDIHDTPVTTVPRGENFSLPDDVVARWNAAGCRLAFLVNPHAPSGRFEPAERFKQVADAFAGVLVIDEAYVDFASGDALDLVRDSACDNVLILRSMSKGYSLAGLRFGYGLGHAGLIAALDKARDSYNTDILSQVAAAAALRRRDAARKTWRAVVAERDRLTEELSKRGYRVFPSQANFLLAVPPTDAHGVYEALKARRILVRYFDSDRLRDKLRITVGTPEQNNALLAALDQLT